jgi:CHAT domain-containing protein/tetratricopeptide (TPR) repeat protein
VEEIMPDPTSHQQCAQAFIDRDYHRCLEIGQQLMRASTRHDTLQMILLSLMRTDQQTSASHFGSQVLAVTARSPWHHTLVRVTLGHAAPADATAIANSDEQRCQAHYYAGARLLAEGNLEAARTQFEAAIATNFKLYEWYFAQADLQTITVSQASAESIDDRLAALNRIANEACRRGRLYEARVHAEQYVELAKHHLGERHPGYGNALNTLAEILRTSGDYTRVEPLITTALAIFRETLGDRSTHAAAALNTLALLRFDMGQFAQAEDLLNEVASIERGDSGVVSTTTLNNLSQIYSRTGRLDRAIENQNTVIERIRAELGADHPHYSQGLDNLASLHVSAGRYARAAELLNEAVEILGRKSKWEGIHYATGVGNLADLRAANGEFEEAERLERRAFDLARAVVGEDHPIAVRFLEGLATVLAARGDVDAALATMKTVTRLQDRQIGVFFGIGSESQRQSFLARLQRHMHAVVSLVLQRRSTSQADVDHAFDVLARRKGVAAEALASQRDAVHRGRYPHLQPQIQLLTDLRGMLASRVLGGPGAESLEAHQKAVAAMTAEKERLEASLAREIGEMSLARYLQALDANAIEAALPQDSILVEFVRIIPPVFDAVRARGELRFGAPRYVAFVVDRSAMRNIRMLDVGNAEEIELLLAEYREWLSADAEAAVFAPSSTTVDIRFAVGLRLRQILLDPVLDSAAKNVTLVIAPDGDLARLPFESLPTGLGDGRFLLDNYRIHYVATSRDLLRHTGGGGTPSAPMVLADPDFDGSDASATGAQNESQPMGTAMAVEEFERLPGTRIEGQRVAQLLGVEMTSGADALESTLKACRSPRILHIATHGFFTESPGGLSDMALDTAVSDNPLHGSGLVLAGANASRRRRRIQSDGEDGFLTAEEVMGLDLVDTELVVLSACETGLGKIYVGEGVFGLRRAFIVAGARNLVMSLWKVPDLETAVVMERLYENIIERALPVSEALRQAQRWLKGVTVRELREAWLKAGAQSPLNAMRLELEAVAQRAAADRPFAHPFSWGAFICQGTG